MKPYAHACSLSRRISCAWSAWFCCSAETWDSRLALFTILLEDCGAGWMRLSLVSCCTSSKRPSGGTLQFHVVTSPQGKTCTTVPFIVHAVVQVHPGNDSDLQEECLLLIRPHLQQQAEEEAGPRASLSQCVADIVTALQYLQNSEPRKNLAIKID